MDSQRAIANNIYAIRNHFGLSQTELAKALNVSQVTVSNWETGSHKITAANIEKIAKTLNLTYDDIASEVSGFASKSNNESEENWMTEVPVYGAIAAGTPIDIMEVDDTREVPTRVVKRFKKPFLLKVEGESMNRVLPNGSYALIEPCQGVAVQGKPYAVCVNGYSATIKRVRQLANGFELIPDSTDPTYRTQVFDYGDPDTDEVTIIGRVVYYVLPYDWDF